MKTLSIDIETFSSVNLAKSGVYRYSESEDFEILLFGYSVDGGPVEVVDFTAGEKLPASIKKALTDDSVMKWAFNAQFERVCISRFLGYPTGKYLDPISWHCTMVWAATLGLPLSLEGVGTVLGLEKQKLKAAFVKPGDIWTVGRHRLVCGDATSADDVAKLMNGKRANLVVTDPPYGVSFKSASGLTIQNDSMKNDEFYQFLLASFKNMADNLEPGGSAYVFHADTEGLNFRRAFIDAGFHLAGCCIWAKNSLVLGRSDYQWQHEPVLYGFLKNGKHNWYSDRKQTTLWNYDKPSRNANHPTSKPLDLLGYPIGNSSQENGIIIDTFGGSGSTLMACEQTNRICYTMELDEKYASVILRRYVEDTGDADGVSVERDGERIPYSELVKEVERNAE